MKTFQSFILATCLHTLATGTLPADTLRFRDGRKLDGIILEEGERVRIRTRFGEYSFPRSDIVEITRAATREHLYEQKRAKLGENDADGHYALALWCKEQKLLQEMKVELELVLLLQPDHKDARAALGYRRVDGQWQLQRADGIPGVKSGEGDPGANTPQAEGLAGGEKNRGHSTASTAVSIRVGASAGAGDALSKKSGAGAPSGEAMPAAPVSAEARAEAAGLCREAEGALEQEHYDRALELLDKALELDPKNSHGWYTRGCVTYILRRSEEALDNLTRAIELEPASGHALYGRASVWLTLGDVAQAIHDLDEVLKLVPNHPGALKQREVLRRVQEGPRWSRKFVRETPHYRIVTDAGQRIADLAGRELEGIYREYVRQFRFQGDEQKRKFNVRIFSSEKDFLHYSEETTGQSLSYALGYYAPTYKELVLKDNANERLLVETLYHEGFHQFLDYFVSNVPSWFNEGLAEYFEKTEASGKQSFKLGALDAGALLLVQKAVREGEHVSLKKLLKTSQRDFVDGSPSGVLNSSMAQLHYAQAWSFIHFLIHSNQGKYKRVVRDFYLALKAGKKPDEAFEDVFGKTNFIRVEEAWREYILELRKSPE